MQDHPRLRGEHGAKKMKAIYDLGSPPPTRGTLFDNFQVKPVSGITPAYAGNTKVYLPLACDLWDHPRLRGEHYSLDIVLDSIKGSPPPTRGTRACILFCVLALRITPAYAGNTFTHLCIRSGVKDHPRLRGEHKSGAAKNIGRAGSPPPTRGTL